LRKDRLRGVSRLQWKGGAGRGRRQFPAHENELFIDGAVSGAASVTVEFANTLKPAPGPFGAGNPGARGSRWPAHQLIYADESRASAICACASSPADGRHRQRPSRFARSDKSSATRLTQKPRPAAACGGISRGPIASRVRNACNYACSTSRCRTRDRAVNKVNSTTREQ